MIAVIFEVIPHAETKQQYLDVAAELKPILVEMDGFISVERFQSLSDPNKLLSLSFWRDETAVAQWRNTEMHRAAQSEGRKEVFADYGLSEESQEIISRELAKDKDKWVDFMMKFELGL